MAAATSTKRLKMCHISSPWYVFFFVTTNGYLGLSKSMKGAEQE